MSALRLPSRVTVVEVGPRDGLQNESVSLSVEDRVAFCDRLVAAGLPVVEVGAFVSPTWVPQMAGYDEVLRRVRKPAGVRLPVLVPNRQGFERPRAAGAREIAVFTAASESFSSRNTNASIDETFERFAALVPEARQEGLRVRGYLSMAFGCPYEGKVAPEAAILVARRLVEAGCDEVSIGDTIGVVVPTQVSELLGRLGEITPLDRVAVHFHDTVWEKKSAAVGLTASAAGPNRYWVELHWGSRSSSSVRRPSAALMAARLQAMVDFTTPPFWLNITRLMRRLLVL